MRRERLVLVVVAAVVYLVSCTVATGGLLDDRPWGDPLVYEEYGRELLDGRIPYDDFYVEYPPLALPTFLLPAAVADDLDGFLLAFKLQTTALGLVGLLGAALVLGRLGAARSRTIVALATIAVAPAALGHVFLNRYDVWPAALVVLGLAALVARQTLRSSALLALAFVAKVFSAAMLPVVAVRVWRTRDLRELVRSGAVFAAVTVVCFAPFLAVGFGGVGYSLWTQARRGLQSESLAASLLLAADAAGVRDASLIAGDPGSVDVGGSLAEALAVLSSGVQVAGVLAVALLFARGAASDERLVAAFAAAATAFTVLGKVLSPQFLVWLVPLVPLVGGSWRRLATALLLASLGLTQLELRGWTGLTVDEWAVWVLLLRNLVLLGLLAVLLSALRGPGKPDRTA